MCWNENRCGCAMSQKVPVDHFEWEKHIKLSWDFYKKYNDNSNIVIKDTYLNTLNTLNSYTIYTIIYNFHLKELILTLSQNVSVICIKKKSILYM